jgi:hypothetical protein
MTTTNDGWNSRRIAAYALIILGALLALNLLLHALPILMMVAILLGPPIWVYLDGTKRGLERASLWALLVLFSNVVGLVVYLIARPDAELCRCARCGANMRPEWRVCAACGAEADPSPICPSCAAPVESGWRYCPLCKGELVLPAAVPAAAEVPAEDPNEPASEPAAEQPAESPVTPESRS